MSPRIRNSTSEEARDALVVQLEDLLEDMTNVKSERAADMLIAALWTEGFKLVPLSDEDKAPPDEP